MENPIDQQLERLRRRADRERSARQEAERLLEDKARELFEANCTLEELNKTLECKVRERTKELEAARRAAMDLAERDQLTGILNRRSFLNQLEALFSELPDTSQVVLYLIDLDRFKGINDTYGHAAGDTLLATIGKRLLTLTETHSNALASRLGGDEFAFALAGPDATGLASGLAHSIVNTIRMPLATKGVYLKPSCSVGFAVAPRDANSSEQLRHYADLALYEAKALGRNQWVEFNPTLLDATNQRLNVLRGLHNADLDEDLELWYQPQHCLESGRVEGIEALVRWRGEDGRFIPPNTFIPLAEENGLVSLITEAVLNRALSEAGDWLKRGLINRICVNISPKDMIEKTLSTMVLSSLQRHRIDPHLLEIELTENAMLWDIEQVRAELEILSRRGVHLALDDFGTGYSNLTYLCTLPFDCLKIDKSFVDNVLTNASTKAVIGSILTLANSLSLRTVAEGVENTDQRDYLRQIGCDIMQGYLASKPLPPEACLDYLEAAKVA